MNKQNIEYYYDIVQNTDEWLEIKQGVLSASTLKNVITAKTLKLSKAANTRLFYDDILSQRIDPTIIRGFTSYDMQRGHDDEPYAVAQYEKEYNQTVKHCGFVINRTLGFDFGYSPDGLVGDDGLIEIKSKVVKHQVKTILDHICGRTDELIPNEHMMQVQAGLFITGRKWCDFISFCNGNQMMTIRVTPIPEYQEAIIAAAVSFEETMQENMDLYLKAVKEDPRLTLTPRRKIIEADIKL